MFRQLSGIVLVVAVCCWATAMVVASDGDEDGPCLVQAKAKSEGHQKYTREAQGKETTEAETKREPPQDYWRLTRLDGVEVGHEQEVDVGEGKKVKLITRSLKPLLFEIPNFLSTLEAETVIARAEETGMFSSLAKGGLTPKDTFVPTSTPGKSLGSAGDFLNWDRNGDGVIDMEEVKGYANFYHYMNMTDEDVLEMFRRVKITAFDDGLIDEAEFEVIDSQGMEDYINILLREHPRFKQRFSEQTWLPMSKHFDPTLHKIRERVGRLTKLPRKILFGGEHLQVLKYVPHGHYHAHHDSETHKRTDLPCCHQTDTATVQDYGKCKLCRFITILFYLNTVEAGGETAFPAADNATYADKNMRTRIDGRADDYFNLIDHCHDANMVVSPVEGSAIMWYNHHVDPETNWLGEMDLFSLHGGCDVKKGSKWISNMWLTAPYAAEADTPSMYLSMAELETE